MHISTDINNFTIKVVSTFRKPLAKQKTEAVLIASSKADHLMNSKAEHRQPAVHRVVRTREGRNCHQLELTKTTLP